MTGTTIMQTSISRGDLLAQGFSEEQADRLEQLRLAGSHLEFVDDARQWKRLCFLKWLYEHGLVHDGEPTTGRV